MSFGWPYLSLNCPVTELLSKSKGHLVMLCCSLKLSKEDVCVSKIAVSSPFRTPIAKLSRNLEPLLVEVDGLGEVSK